MMPGKAGAVVQCCGSSENRLDQKCDGGAEYCHPGFLKTGDHVITSGMEHNSVMRPLRLAEARGVDLTVVLPVSKEGLIDPARIPARSRKIPGPYL